MLVLVEVREKNVLDEESQKGCGVVEVSEGCEEEIEAACGNFSVQNGNGRHVMMIAN